jgi:hypothetical protein
MSNSYRIRTQVGVDKSIKVLLDQDFEYLEILSLKVLQSQIYTRKCSDYGVIVGRVTTNGGFGIPNAKVSVFIPLTSEDETNPIISELYPYKSLSQLNEDGYRYNLLPYEKSYSEHSPTGTFFTREDVLIDSTLIEVFDKYFRYTARTNESGDYMIFGVPVGEQTIHVDIDLSDIGDFSLSPQDLIRMGRATESQVAGTRFKSSTNLAELPQIISINRILEVEPLWGQPEICNLGITRTDFDLSDEANITITPTSIFMGSIVSSPEDQFQKRNCKPKIKQGKLCGLVTGPGEILAIRHTIDQDINGRPLLETVDLESGGQVIDDNGAWLVDVPMNLDYVTTNEFGEKVLSNNPKIGIPTKGRYRFKVKWNQSPSLSETIKRGYFLVPNIREYGWDISGYNTDPLKQSSTTLAFQTAIKSYAFSLDWDDYADIQAAISCDDTFYEMLYNKVYTVSQLITQYRRGYLPNRMIVIKDILGEECETENVKFPTNDAVFRLDIIFLLFNLMMFVFRPIIYVLLLVVHILAFLLKYILGPILAVIVGIVMGLVIIICSVINGIIDAINSVANILGLNINNLNCPTWEDLAELVDKMLNLYKLFTHLNLPNLTYPDCELCSCKEGDIADDGTNTGGPSPVTTNTGAIIANSNINSVLSQYTINTQYTNISTSYTYPSSVTSLLAGQSTSTNDGTSLSPQLVDYGNDPLFPTSTYNSTYPQHIFTSSLTLAERINLFNTKAKYFTPNGAINQIKVSFQPSTPLYHLDNIVVMSCSPSKLGNFPAGQLISFQDTTLSKDINLTGVTSLNAYGTPSITGGTIIDGVNNTLIGTSPNQYVSHTFTLPYANPNGTGNLTGPSYTITGETDDVLYAKFPMDVEYFQVVTAMTYSSFATNCVGATITNNLNSRFLNNDIRFEFVHSNNCWYTPSNYVNPLTSFKSASTQVIVILVRGVDPYSPRTDVSYDLSRIFGHNAWGTKVVTGQYKLNWPIQGSYKAVDHDITSSTVGDVSYANQNLYYESFHFQPSPTDFSGFTSDLPKYYSSLGGNLYPLPGFAPTGAPNINPNFIDDTSQGLLVNSSNRFTTERDTSVIPPYPYCDFYNLLPNTTSAQNRGYYINESVEGGSAMYQTNLVNTPVSTIPQIFINNTNDYQPNVGITVNSYYYAPTYSTVSINYTLGSNGRQIVMRSDRLPTSTTTLNSGGNSFALQNNINFTVFSLDDEGTVSDSAGQTIGGNPTGGFPSDNETDDNSAEINEVFESFNCGGLVPLGCYYYDGTGFRVRDKPDGCYENGIDGEMIMVNGCYVLVTSIFLSLIKDFKLLAEWFTRTTINFGACRNVWSHLFTNNWINGTLYSFSFKNDRFFSGPNATPPNKPYSSYCRDTVILHPTTNNFYYRSSPYLTGGTGSFIGQERPAGGTWGGNVRNLMFPTTIMDLGPRSQYLQEIIMSDDYDGYVVQKLNSTTYGDVSEILNYLILSRLVNTNVIEQLLGGGEANILTYFNSRGKNMVDGDYAQLISIQSEFGVSPFEAANYPTPPSGIPPLYSNGNAKDVIIGIFFSSDTQSRDFITPKRTIIDPTVNVTDQCAFSYFNVFTQNVPFYQWEVKSNPDSDSIFGSESNDWYTDPINGNSFMSNHYQKLDRIQMSSRYFRPNTTTETQYFKGLIYSVTGLLPTPGDLNANAGSQEPNSPLWSSSQRFITVGAPQHFYFGLKKGKTAFDRFATKWISTATITD